MMNMNNVLKCLKVHFIRGNTQDIQENCNQGSSKANLHELNQI